MLAASARAGFMPPGAAEGPPRNPFPTVDVIIERGEDRILLVRRRNLPLGWALPGGFIDYGESAEDAARREALEETGLHVRLSILLGVYSAPDRDPRHHTMSVVYVARADGQQPVAGSDAAGVGEFRLSELPDLAFDHARILDDFRAFRADGTPPEPA